MTDGLLRGTLLGAFAWTAAARVVAEAATLAAMVVTARAVSPADFGRASVATVVTLLAISLTQQGIGSPLVQRPEATPQDIKTAWSLSLLLGCAGSALGIFLVAPALSDIFDPRTADMMQLACVAFVCCSVGVVPVALLQRRLQFRQLALVDAIASVAAATVTGAVAVAAHSGFAIVWGALTLATITALGSLAVQAPHGGVKVGFSSTAAKELVSFGGLSALSGILYIAVSKIDYAILAARLGPGPMGFYARGFQVAFDYPGKATAVLVRLALPLMSRSSSAVELRDLRAKMTSAHTTLLLPYPMLLIVLAPVLVPAVFGAVWEPAVVPTQILAFAGMTAIVAAGTSPLIQALGRPGAMVLFTTLELAVFVVVLLVSVPHGVTVVCWAIAGARVALLVSLQRFVVQPIAGIPALESLRTDLAPAVGAGIPMMIVSWAVLELLQSVGAPSAIALAAACGAGIACYGIGLRALFLSNWSILADAGRRLGAPATSLLRRRAAA